MLPAQGQSIAPALTTLQCFRRARVHHQVQRTQAWKVSQVDHLQDLRRLEGDCRRGVLHHRRLCRIQRKAPERKEQGQKGKGRRGCQIRRLRFGIRDRWRGQQVWSPACLTTHGFAQPTREEIEANSARQEQDYIHFMGSR